MGLDLKTGSHSASEGDDGVGNVGLSYGDGRFLRRNFLEFLGFIGELGRLCYLSVTVLGWKAIQGMPDEVYKTG